MMKYYEIEKEFHFSASHQLRGLPEDHQCARLHGHNYILKVHLGCTDALDQVGFVVDYGELAFVKKWVDDLDHRHLNDIFDFNPTSELIAGYFLTDIVQIVVSRYPSIDTIRVSLSETPKTWCTVTAFIIDGEPVGQRDRALT